ncbi:MAG: CBS domain-containing protein [Deltaproteobacteria bacterium]|nr:CBS domain-containing protein [Deltaproteobacteria bacterium]
MEKNIVKNLMVPLSGYATVSVEATLQEAVLALEKAQEEFTENRYSHRAVLILGKDKRIIGKLSQWDFVRALEWNNEQDGEVGDIGKFGFSSKAIIVHKEKHRVKSVSGEEILSTAGNSKVKDFMQIHSEGEYIDENTSLDTAVHQFTIGLHLSLLVTRGKDIVGVLRLSDVFAAAFHAMKKSELKE